ncbi:MULTISPECIES: hypothetical protein [unclassified Solibacillus]|uniref:hypothetical protein n=1 Tax=unclassified Solibacillus TaxID=2637870 RepID=UPI0030FCB1AA
MKIINSIIGLLIIIWGSLLLSITVHDETSKTLMYKVNGTLFMTLGILYLRNFAKWGKR